MKDFFIGFITGAVLMAFTGWYYQSRNSHPMRHAQDVTAAAIQQAYDSTTAKLEAWHLTNHDIESELNKTGRVVRHRMSDFGAAIADAATDTKTTARIKAKFALDKNLSSFGISVSTTDGRVTLSGDVPSYGEIGRAILLAQETDGVREVDSTLKVKTAGS